jgi:glycerol-3-phosphate dehydrogenase (NAD(P)+)
MNNVIVIGAGAWGTALALQAHRAGRRVTLWTRTPFTGRCSPHLPGYALPDDIAITAELPRTGDPMVMAVPLQHMRSVAARLDGSGPVLVCSKGVEAGRLLLPLEVVAEAMPGVAAGVLTGPNFAHEVAAGLPAASVVAAVDAGLRAAFMALLGTPGFRLYGNDDPVGAQIGGAAKNVIAIAAGVVMGAGLGENARAALITRGLSELGRLAAALGGRAETVAGLSGLGDLMLTCTGASSRNFRCGLALGRGAALADAVAGAGGVVEGVATAPALVARAAGVELPVCQAVAALLAGHMTVGQAAAALMARPLRDE